MKILVTGACGNVGSLTVIGLLERGYEVRAFDLPTDANHVKAAAFEGKLEMRWGDITKPESIESAVQGVDHILHLAAIIPPHTDVDQLLGYAVNVGGMRNLLAAVKQSEKRPRVVFCSTPAVYGKNAEATEPRRVSEPVHPEDSYGRQKVECEAMLRESGVDFCIFRLAVTPPLDLAAISPFIFDFHPETRVELTHPRDVALALTNSVLTGEIDGKVLNIGGGAGNRMLYRDFLNGALGLMGVRPLPSSAFGEHLFLTDWLDTEESQRLLDYQRRSYDDFLDDMRDVIGPARHLIGAVEPLVRAYMLANSPYQAASEGKTPILVEALKIGSITSRGLKAFKPYAKRWMQIYLPG